MRNAFLSALPLLVSTSVFIPATLYAYGNFGDNVNTLCAPKQPYTGDCGLCHIGAKADPTPAKQAYLAGGQTLLDYFCPAAPAPTCTDKDGDGYAVEGGACGPVDCNDSSAAVHPGAPEICGDGIDQDCNGVDMACTKTVLPPIIYLLKR